MNLSGSVAFNMKRGELGNARYVESASVVMHGIDHGDIDHRDLCSNKQVIYFLLLCVENLIILIYFKRAFHPKAISFGRGLRIFEFFTKSSFKI